MFCEAFIRKLQHRLDGFPRIHVPVVENPSMPVETGEGSDLAHRSEALPMA
jgi:hypothetical protein